MGQPVVHFEVSGTNAERLRRFYGELFDWDMMIDPTGYALVDTKNDEGIKGGIMQAPKGTPSYVTFYVEVDDLDKALLRVDELGGRRILPPMPVGDRASMAMFVDPDGNMIGLFTETPPTD